MTDFPAFLKNPVNRIAASSQFTDDIEGYVFDGADGSQVALWTAHAEMRRSHGRPSPGSITAHAYTLHTGGACDDVGTATYLRALQ